nr:MAG TPA: hypothetical protein [Crassvirales sp.]
MPDYSFVVSPSFNPFSMQEMLVPFSAYKDAFEKSEEQYDTLSQGADKFKYLSETLPEGSKARQIYEGYTNDLRAQAEDLAHNGLTMGNRRALTSLKRRYQGEMGRILQADEAMREEKKLRQSLGAQDTSLLYANDNLNIDDFLDGKNPNLYRISGNELYTRGAAAGKAASSRIFSAGDAGSTLNGYYRDYVQKLGYSPETIRKFYNDMSTIPELQMAADAILEERGVNKNLSGYNLRRARQSVINGMIDGAVYQENHSPQRDLGVMTPMEQNQIDMQQKQFNLSKSQLDARAASMGYRIDDNGNLQIDPDRMKVLKELKKSGKGTGATGSSNTNSSEGTIAKDAITITWSGKPYSKKNSQGNDNRGIKTTRFKDDDGFGDGRQWNYDDLPEYAQTEADKYVGNGSPYDYKYIYSPWKKGHIWDDDEFLIMLPVAKRVKDSDPEIDTSIH